MINQVFQSWSQKQHNQLDIEINVQNNECRCSCVQNNKCLVRGVELYGTFLGFFAKIFGWSIELKVNHYAGITVYQVSKESLIREGQKIHVDFTEFAKQSVVSVDERLLVPAVRRVTFFARLTCLQDLMVQDPNAQNLETEQCIEQIMKMIGEYPKLKLLIPTEQLWNAIFSEYPKEINNFYNLVVVPVCYGFFKIRIAPQYPAWDPMPSNGPWAD